MNPDLTPAQKKKLERVKQFSGSKELGMFAVAQDISQSLQGLEDAEIITIKGKKGDVGPEPSDKRLKDLIVPLIPEPIKGETGRKGEDSQIPGPKGEKGDRGEKGEKGLDGLNGKDGKDGKNGVDGINGLNGRNGKDGKDGGGGVRIGWGAHPLKILDGSTVIDKVARIINFGTNLTATRAADGTITVNASGGSGFTELTATGTVDGSNTTFTFIQEPTYIVMDGVWMKKNKGWTFAGLTATMTVPPNDDIYGVA